MEIAATSKYSNCCEKNSSKLKQKLLPVAERAIRIEIRKLERPSLVKYLQSNLQLGRKIEVVFLSLALSNLEIKSDLFMLEIGFNRISCVSQLSQTLDINFVHSRPALILSESFDVGSLERILRNFAADPAFVMQRINIYQPKTNQQELLT